MTGNYGAASYFRDIDQAEREPHSVIIREVFGNPYRPHTVNPSWLTATVVGLAELIYDERVFSRLPILADALEEAGCTDANILDHCRQFGLHVLGCFALDSILRKK